MQEWMRNKEIRNCFRMQVDPDNNQAIENFINNSFTEENKHYAIIDENDIYQGTISLKNIDMIDKNAEYAIVLRKEAMNKNIAKEATKILLNIAFENLGLNRIYLNVLSDNLRAIRFYEKMGFLYEGEFKNHIYLRNQFHSLKWYAIVN